MGGFGSAKASLDHGIAHTLHTVEHAVEVVAAHTFSWSHRKSSVSARKKSRGSISSKEQAPLYLTGLHAEAGTDLRVLQAALSNHGASVTCHSREDPEEEGGVPSARGRPPPMDHQSDCSSSTMKEAATVARRHVADCQTLLLLQTRGVLSDVQVLCDLAEAFQNKLVVVPILLDVPEAERRYEFGTAAGACKELSKHLKEHHPAVLAALKLRLGAIQFRQFEKAITGLPFVISVAWDPHCTDAGLHATIMDILRTIRSQIAARTEYGDAHPQEKTEALPRNMKSWAKNIGSRSSGSFIHAAARETQV